MIFSQNNIPQAINIPFNWVADYFNGESLTEYDLVTHKPNSFYSIRQNETLRFGLIGNGMKLYFETTDGHFHLKDRRVDIEYINDDGTVFYLTNNPNKKDFITYKQAYTDLDRNTIIQHTNIESINFGYKTRIH